MKRGNPVLSACITQCAYITELARYEENKCSFQFYFILLQIF